MESNYLIKLVKWSIDNDFESKKVFKYFYSELYFTTTEDLKIMKSVIMSKMIKSNSTAITLSLIAFFSSFSIILVNLCKDILEKETEIAAIVALNKSVKKGQ